MVHLMTQGLKILAGYSVLCTPSRRYDKWQRGELDVLVNNAGFATHGPALDLDVDDVVAPMFGANLFGILTVFNALSDPLINGTIKNRGVPELYITPMRALLNWKPLGVLFATQAMALVQALADYSRILVGKRAAEEVRFEALEKSEH
ncbi:hypothetical protein E4U53_005549 [Claviceps sorghi]|nr:hypothetical protein E4U53_005549 [Claviceps sorghi]